MKKKEKKTKQMKQQLGISDRKSIEERGRQMRSAVFVDKKKKASKEACSKTNIKKILSDF